SVPPYVEEPIRAMPAEPEALDAETLELLTLQSRARQSHSWETSRDRIRAEVGHLRAVVKSPHARRTAAAIERELAALDRRLPAPRPAACGALDPRSRRRRAEPFLQGGAGGRRRRLRALSARPGHGCAPHSPRIRAQRWHRAVRRLPWRGRRTRQGAGRCRAL